MVKILLVEDNEMNSGMLSRRHARKGHDFSITIDGQESFDLPPPPPPPPPLPGPDPSQARGSPTNRQGFAQRGGMALPHV